MIHPWITRDFKAKIPRTVFEENIFRYELDNKLRNVNLRVSHFSVSKQYFLSLSLRIMNKKSREKDKK